MNGMDDLFENKVVNIMNANSLKFTHQFIDWLPENLHIWKAFEFQAFLMIKRGREYYSSKTIIHYLRHHSVAMEKPSGEFKISNNHASGLARLFHLVHPKHNGFFKEKFSARAASDHTSSHIF